MASIGSNRINDSQNQEHKDEALNFLELGKEAAENIKEDNDKEYRLSEIKAVEEML